MDSHSVLVVERTQAKIVTRLSCDEMLCPVHIAFMKSIGEIYVTGKQFIYDYAATSKLTLINII